LDFWGGEIAYRVTQIDRAIAREVGSSSITFRCPDGPNRATLHVHPANSCLGEDGPCFPGGPYAYQCLASPTDYRSLDGSGDAFAMVQCSREAVVTYWPDLELTDSRALPQMRSGSIVKGRRPSPFPTGETRYRPIS
jgi:hypothetical protein